MEIEKPKCNPVCKKTTTTALMILNGKNGIIVW